MDVTVGGSMRCLVVAIALLAVLLLPTSAGAEPNAVRYTVRRGDTLSGIAKRFGVSVGSICRWNAIKKDAMLTPGRKIGVPLPKGRSAKIAASEPSAGKTWRDYARTPEHPGWIAIASYTQSWQGRLVGEKGELLADGTAALSSLLGGSEDASMDERLLGLIARVSDTFGGRRIYVISGYRPGRRSRHAHGQAVDFRIHGVPNWALRDYVRTLGSVGVGYYPNSTFVHLDVRDRPTYWVDVSRPGQRARYTKAKKKRRRARR